MAAIPRRDPGHRRGAANGRRPGISASELSAWLWRFSLALGLPAAIADVLAKDLVVAHLMTRPPSGAYGWPSGLSSTV
jgi:hypothetical protein